MGSAEIASRRGSVSSPLIHSRTPSPGSVPRLPKALRLPAINGEGEEEEDPGGGRGGGGLPAGLASGKGPGAGSALFI